MRTARPPRPAPHGLRALGRLAPFVAAHRLRAGLALSFVVLSTAAILGLTAAGRFAIDHAGAVRSRADLVAPFAGLAAVAAVFAVTTALRIYFVTTLGERVGADIRRALYDRVLTLDPTRLAGVRTGELLTRLTSDVTVVENLVGNLSSVSLRNLLSLAGALAVIALTRPQVAALLLLAPLLILPLMLFRRRFRAVSASAADRFGEAVGFAGESLEGLETVQAFGREARASARFGEAVEAALAAAREKARARALVSAVMIAAVFTGLFALLAEGAYATYVARTMSPGALVQLGVLSILAASAVSALGEAWGEVGKAAVSVGRLGELLDAEPVIRAPAHPRPLPVPPRGALALEAVAFRYPGEPDRAALRGVSLGVRPGERVALVGPSGAGKSTVFKLLLRFYDPDAGVLRLDGVDLREADPRAVRARFALVSQDPSLFSGTVADNIDFGDETADAARVAAAAKAAQVEAFLGDRAAGLQTAVGERAKTLSGGQRQRLALARALVRDAPVLLLDEATSALDAENERLVHDALAQAGRNRTTLIIAHRLATVMEADRIVVMDAGRVVDEGTHAELVTRGGLYARLAALQFAA